jgi:hypothetical protein
MTFQPHHSSKQTRFMRYKYLLNHLSKGFMIFYSQDIHINICSYRTFITYQNMNKQHCSWDLMLFHLFIALYFYKDINLCIWEFSNPPKNKLFGRYYASYIKLLHSLAIEDKSSSNNTWLNLLSNHQKTLFLNILNCRTLSSNESLNINI